MGARPRRVSTASSQVEISTNRLLRPAPLESSFALARRRGQRASVGPTTTASKSRRPSFPGTSPELAHSPSRQQAGWYFDRGLYTVLFAIALGILTEISRNVRANTATANEAP